MPSVAEILGLKTPTPTALDTAGIRARWSQRLREQALFSVRMTLQGYLDRVQAVLMQVADGTLDASAARIALTDKLAELGYTPEPGTAGTLKDARTLARLNLVLKTNRQTAASLAQLAESEDPQVAALFPAWELASGGYRKQHRTDWPQRWKAAGERVAWRGASRTKMVALKSSPIWQALGDGAGGFRDTLGNPYPPFAFGSSYEWVPVDRLEARELGLLDEAANRAARRAAALLITALAVKAIRNKNEIDHCPKDGTILDKDGQCPTARDTAGRKANPPLRGTRVNVRGRRPNGRLMTGSRSRAQTEGVSASTVLPVTTTVLAKGGRTTRPSRRTLSGFPPPSMPSSMVNARSSSRAGQRRTIWTRRRERRRSTRNGMGATR